MLRHAHDGEQKILEGGIMQRILLEKKMIGNNPLMISISLVLVFILISFLGGNLINFSILGFEVIFPFYAAIAIGEWGKFKSDTNYDIIASQSRSIFGWVFYRFLTIFGFISSFAIVGMLFTSLIRGEMPWGEMVFTYFSPALFLSSLAVLSSLAFSTEHIATMICGTIWLLAMLLRSLLRFKYVEYVYLFIRFAGDQNGIWVINKTILIFLSIILWSVIYWLCQKKH